MSREASMLGAKVRALRRQKSVSQVQLAERLGISPSYLNLIEHNRRAMPAPLLIKIAEIFELDLKALSTEQDARTVADLMELFGDPIFEHEDVTTAEVRDLAAHAPTAARGILKLYHAFREAREAADNLAIKISGKWLVWRWMRSETSSVGIRDESTPVRSLRPEILMARLSAASRASRNAW